MSSSLSPPSLAEDVNVQESGIYTFGILATTAVQDSAYKIYGIRFKDLRRCICKADSLFTDVLLCHKD
eukprot:1749978-Pyramimonas_sp.AAC.1